MKETVPACEVSPEEEKTILFYYQIKMLELCEYLKAPIQVHSTAITYFKLLFTKKKVYHYDMRNLIAACVFLAMKVENIYITAEILKSRLSFVSTKLVVKYEMDICHALKFNLHVNSPHLRLLGLFLMIRNKARLGIEVDESAVQTQEIAELDSTLSWEKCLENLKNIMLSDNYLELNLNEVALASLAAQPSELQGFFMQDTIDNVKKIRMASGRREAPSQEELKKIDSKIRLIQEKYHIATK